MEIDMLASASPAAVLRTPNARIAATPSRSPVFSPLLSPEHTPERPVGHAMPPPSFASPSSHHHHQHHARNTSVVPADCPVQEGRVASLAGEYMLMEYAAEIKGLTQINLVRTVRAAQQLPRELGEVAQRIRTHAVRLVAALKAELADLTSGRRAAQGQLRRIRNAHGHLQAATELLNQAEVRTVAAAKKRRQSSRIYVAAPTPAEEEAADETSAAPVASPTNKLAAVNNLAAMMASMAPAAPAAVAAAPATVAAPAAAQAKNMVALQEQIAMLKAQMETMARLQSLMPAAAAAVAANVGGSAAIAASGPAIPLAPALSSSRPSAPVPPAPALTADSYFFTGIKPVVAPAPDAPPMSDALAREILSPRMKTHGRKSTTPAVQSASAAAAGTAPENARSAMLGEITSRTLNKASLRATPAKKRLSQRSQSVIDTSADADAAIKAAEASSAIAGASSSSSPVKAASTTANAANPLNVFVRRIPGAESMSFTDSIKVASKIKLRSTGAERSPGGTPVRDRARAAFASNATAELLHAALAAKFRNANGGAAEAAMHKQRSHSVMMSNKGSLGRTVNAPMKTQQQQQGAGSRRNSIDKENWETS